MNTPFSLYSLRKLTKKVIFSSDSFLSTCFEHPTITCRDLDHQNITLTRSGSVRKPHDDEIPNVLFLTNEIIVKSASWP